MAWCKRSWRSLSIRKLPQSVWNGVKEGRHENKCDEDGEVGWSMRLCETCGRRCAIGIRPRGKELQREVPQLFWLKLSAKKAIAVRSFRHG